MIKLFDLLKEQNNILIPRRSPEDRQKNYNITIQKKIQQYIKDGGKGNLDLDDTPTATLPAGLSVGEDLFLNNTKLTSLPANLHVGGGLYLYKTKITSLPNDLSIGGGLFLNNSLINSLPDGLSISKDLNLSYSKIKSIPNNLSVGGDLNLMNTPISKKYTIDQLKQMLPGVKGRILV